jgi:hypothetical protein
MSAGALTPTLTLASSPLTYMSYNALIGCGIAAAKKCPVNSQGVKTPPWTQHTCNFNSIARNEVSTKAP